jgi:hypothetical protein
MRKERIVLKDHAEVALLRRLRGDLLVRYDYRAGIGSLEAGDHPQQRRLAAAARPQQHEYLTLGYFEREIFEDGLIPKALVEGGKGEKGWHVPWLITF